MARAPAGPPLQARRRRLTDLDWDGCVNARVVAGDVVRSDNACGLTDAGWQAAFDHGIRTVVDLRSEGERAADPPPRAGIAYVRIPLSDFDRPPRAEPEDKAEALRLWYSEHLEHNATGVVAVLRAVARADGGVLVHCLGGKDRTGIVAALLLRLAGATLEQIEADYVRSEANLLRIFDVINAPPGVIGPVIEGLEAQHGSVAAYLTDAGLEPDDVERLRYRLGAVA